MSTELELWLRLEAHGAELAKREMFLAAADEIDRLRAENAQLESICHAFRELSDRAAESAQALRDYQPGDGTIYFYTATILKLSDEAAARSMRERAEAAMVANAHDFTGARQAIRALPLIEEDKQ